MPRKRSTWEKISETWVLEGVGIIVAAICLAATGALLQKFEGQRVPQWPISLNFLLSLLGNIGFAATMFSVQSSVSQFKWIRFAGGPKPLAELATFHNAKSPLGALRLVLTIGIFSPVIITAAAAIVLGTLWGPFTQNLIQYHEESLVDAQPALLARSIKYSARGVSRSYLSWAPHPSLRNEISTDIIMAPSEESNVPRFSCSTGNCTWDPIATFGYCTQCADISPQILFNCTTEWTCHVALPNNTIHFSHTRSSSNIFFSTTNVDQEHALIYGNTSASATVIQALRLLPPYPFGYSGPHSVTRENYTATECSLNPCVRSLQATVERGVYREEILAEWIAPSSAYNITPPWGPELGVSPGQVYGFAEQVYRDWTYGGNFLDTLLSGNAMAVDGNTGVVFEGTELMEIIYNNRFVAGNCNSPNADTFACVIYAVGTAISRNFRNAAFLGNETGPVPNATNPGDLAVGRTLGSGTFVRVSWLWMLLPGGVWVLGAVTWMSVALMTRQYGVPAWRDNPLPLVFVYGRPDDSAAQVSGRRERSTWTRPWQLAEDVNSNAAYQKVAEQQIAKLQLDEAGIWRLGEAAQGRRRPERRATGESGIEDGNGKGNGASKEAAQVRVGDTESRELLSINDRSF